tara:strand:+ start:898 stop:1602 length:705 start_codon:yes stop_codon:yes gene_type:complete
MIATIMAAGKGSRISKITNNKPKSFLELRKNFSIIDYQIELLRKLKIKKIIIVVGYKYFLFKKKFNNQKDIKLVYNNNWMKDNVLSSFSTALRYLNDDFIFLHADSLTEISVYKKFKNNKNMSLPYKKKKCGYEEMKVFKILNKIYLSKKKIKKQYLGEFIGLAYIPKKYLPEINIGIQNLRKDKEFNKFYFEEIINYLSYNSKHKINLVDIKLNNYQEIDFFSDYKKAVKKFS